MFVYFTQILNLVIDRLEKMYNHVNPPQDC